MRRFEVARAVRAASKTWEGKLVGNQRELLRKLDLFAELSGEEIDSILSLMRKRSLKKGKTVFHQNDMEGGLFFIIDGEVKISRLNRNGREITIATLREGNFFGEMSLIDGGPRSASATAVRPCKLLELKRKDFINGVLSNAEIVSKMLIELSRRLRDADQSIESLALGTVYERLVHTLSRMGGYVPTESEKPVTVRRSTHRDLADLVGSSRETVTRTLSTMEKGGLIKVHRAEIELLPAFFEEKEALS